jgi:ABC-type Mn2+/Zn2+ transport system ATPase subunit
MDPKLMLLDEPTQGMGHEDVELVTQLIQKVAADRTVLMVEHNMSVVGQIADPSPCCSSAKSSPRAVRRGLAQPEGARGLHGQHRRRARRHWRMKRAIDE